MTDARALGWTDPASMRCAMPPKPGRLDAVWCLSPDRLARMYAYQVIVLDELARHGVAVLFHDTPPLADDPQTHLLTQVQGVIAEYERAKIAERYRRGKLWRARAGEVIAWKCAYGYRRIARCAERAAHLEVYEPEAAIVRRIFRDYVESSLSMRQITWQLNQELVPSPSGKAVWSVSTIGRLIRNDAYVGRAYYNRTTSVLDRHPGKRPRQVRRPRDQWIPIAIPSIVGEELFEAAQRVSYDNSKWSPRRTEPDHWLLRGLVKCGHCGVSVSCHKMRGRNGAFNYYYYCHNHDPLRAGGEHRRCPERNIRADELDVFVFDQVRATMLRPDVLLTGEAAVSTRREAGGDELLATQVARFDRKLDSVAAERRRLADLYQANFIEREELLRRGKELELRSCALEAQRRALIDQRAQLAQQNQLRDRVEGFADKVRTSIDRLDFDQRQKLLRLVIDEVRVIGWQVEIRLRIPLDSPPEPPDKRVSTKDRLRSLHDNERRKLSPKGRNQSYVAQTKNRYRHQARQRERVNGIVHRQSFLTRIGISACRSAPIAPSWHCAATGHPAVAHRPSLVSRHSSRPRNPSQRRRLTISATCTSTPTRSARLPSGSTTSRQHRPHWMWSCHSLRSPIGVAGTGSALWGSSGTGHWPFPADERRTTSRAAPRNSSSRYCAHSPQIRRSAERGSLPARAIAARNVPATSSSGTGS